MVRLRRCDPQGRIAIASFPWDTPTERESAIESGHEGNFRNEIKTFPDGDVVQSLRDRNGKARLEMRVWANGIASQRIFDAAEKGRFAWATSPNGLAKQGIFDKEGRERFTTGVDSEGDAYHVANNPKQNQRIITMSQNSGDIGQVFIGADGKMKNGIFINGQGSASYFVEKSAADNAANAIDWGLRVLDLIKLIQ